MTKKVLFVSDILHRQDGEKLLCPLDGSMSACGEHCAWFNKVEDTCWQADNCENNRALVKGTKFFCKDDLIGVEEKAL